MSINLAGLELTRPERTIHILDKSNEKTGLSLLIRADTDDEFIKIQRRATDRYASGKKISVRERREMGESLLMGRVSGWDWAGKALEVVEKAPPFNSKNLKSVMYENGEQSAAIRKQVNEALADEEDFSQAD